MKFTAKQIADYLHGEVDGNESTTVETFAKIEEGLAGAISFLANPRYEHYIYNTQSSIVLVNKDFVPSQPVAATLVRVDNAYEAIARLLTLYQQFVKKRGQLPFTVLRQELIYRRQVFLIRASTAVQVHIQNQSSEQISFPIVPKMITLSLTGVSNDNTGKYLSKKGITVQIRHAVPGVTMLGRYQVEHLHFITIFLEEHGRITIKLPLWISNDCGLTTLDSREQRWTDHRSRFHSTRCSKNSYMPVQSGVLG